jgi:hypothetical protein
MFDPMMNLLSQRLVEALNALENGGDASAWDTARQAIETAGDGDEDLAAIVTVEDQDALRGMIEEWVAVKRLLPESDRGVLKRALKAYRKRLKLTQLDAESSIGGGPMSSGRPSGILGITPPERYPREVWDELVRQGRLRSSGQGMYELPPGG